MEIANTAPTSTAAATIKTPDPETETPTRIQPIKPLPFTNGVLKRHQPLHHHHHLNGPPVVVTYKECLKNHAASLGGHAVDGCGEFMPSPTATHVDPTSLKCAACGCHRNFHRREPDDIHPAPNPAPPQHVIEFQSHHRHHPPPPLPSRGGGANSSSPNSPSPPPISSSYYPSAPHMLLALSAGLSGGPPQENNLSIPTTPGTGAAANTVSNSNGRKRFRTKFTQDQKEKMHEFADRVGWKMQKRDEEIITGFCNEIGVDKGVFKVWMHNNKSTLGKKSDTNNNGNHNGTSGDRVDFGRNNLDSNHYHHHHNHHEDTGNSHSNDHHLLHNNNDSVSTGNVIATNGSSSSS